MGSGVSRRFGGNKYAADPAPEGEGEGVKLKRRGSLPENCSALMHKDIADIPRSRLAALDYLGNTKLHFLAANGSDNYLSKEAPKFSRHERDDAIDLRNKNGRTPLMLAAAGGHAACVQTLLDLGPDVFKSDMDGCTAFQLAATRGHLRVCGMMMNRLTPEMQKELLEMKDKQGRTALHNCIIGGMNFEKNIEKNNTRLTMLEEDKSGDQMQRLLVHFASSEPAVLLMSLFKGWAKATKVLLAIEGVDRGIDDIDASDETMNALLEYKADVMAMDNRQCLPLRFLVDRKQGLELADKLFTAGDKGAQIQHVDKMGYTHLHYAAEAGSLPFVEEFAKFIDVNVLAKDRCSPLHLAAREGRYPVCKWLLDNRALAGVRCDGYAPGQSFSAADLAKARHHLATEKLLRELEAGLLKAAEKRDRLQVKSLMDRGADLEACGANGVTPLMIATNKKDISIVTMLLEAKANPSAADYQSRSVLTFAVDPTHARIGEILQVVQALLKAKGDPNHVDQTGSTVLHTSCSTLEEVTNVLLAGRADPNICDAEGKSPLMVAVAAKANRIARRLLDYGADSELQDSQGRTALDHCGNNNTKTWLQHILEERPTGSFLADGSPGGSVGRRRPGGTNTLSGADEGSPARTGSAKGRPGSATRSRPTSATRVSRPASAAKPSAALPATGEGD